MKEQYKYPQTPEKGTRASRLRESTSHPTAWRRLKVFTSALEDHEDFLKNAIELLEILDDPDAVCYGELLEETLDFLQRLRGHEYDTLLTTFVKGENE